MKKLSFMILAALLLAACNKTEDALQGDDLLILEIATSAEREMVEPAELPQTIQAYVDDVYFDSYIETAFRVPERGYELNMGCGDNLFFGMNGNTLRFRGPDDGRFGPDGPHGPCRPTDFGVPVLVANLPAPIQEYINENYPGREAARAKRRDGNVIILLRGPVLLLFDGDGNFVEELTPLHHCFRPCREVTNENMPAAIATYIESNYPDAEFRKACARNGRVAVYLVGENGRIILIFDLAGNLLFVRE